MLSNLATPLSLLVIGASFVWGDALKKAKPTVLASLIKLVVLPAIFLPLAIKLGFRDEQLMAILIMLGSPSTPSGYIMAKQMGNDDVLANGIIVLTTLLAAVTITLWIFLLRSFGLL
jgi:predicted permease